MVAMHDTTRRRVALTLFVLLAVLPLVGSIAWCISRHSTSHVEAMTRAIADRLDHAVKVESAEHVRPGVVRFERLELLDPETESLALAAREITLSMKETAPINGETADREPTTVSGDPTKDDTAAVEQILSIEARQVRIDAGETDGLTELIARLLMGRRPTDPRHIHLTTDTLLLDAGLRSQSICHATAELKPLRGCGQAELSFHLPCYTECSRPVRVRLVCDRTARPPEFGFEIDTAGAKIPCQTLGLFLPVLGDLGTRADFIGWIGARHSADGWEIRSRGRIEHLDLDRIVGDHFPHKLSGDASILLTDLVIKNDRLDYIQGQLVAGPGLISRSLLVSASREMNLPSPDRIVLLDQTVPYQKLSAYWTIDGEQLTILPGISVEPPAVLAETVGQSMAVITDAEGTLLTGPPAPQPIVSLIRALVPENRHQVPATEATDWLIRHLPLPPVIAPAPAAPEARIRLGRAADEPSM